MNEEGGKRTRRLSAKKLTQQPSTKQSASRDEFDFIEHIRRRTLKRQATPQDESRQREASASSLIPHPSSLIHGIGDDAAVLRQARASGDLVVTADMLVEEIDFRRGYTPPHMLGHKALAVSLSDIAAMGARPLWALLSVGVPHDVWQTDFLEQFYEGFDALALEHRVTLVGGDVSRTPAHVVVDSIVLGEVARGRALLRAGARAGDRIYVTGTLGGASAGLRLLEGGARLKANRTGSAHLDANRTGSTGKSTRDRVRRARERLMLRQLRPTPRLAWGAWLCEQRLATAMIDLSDGLSSDLAHLCRESGVGAKIDASRIPSDPSIAQARLDDDAAHALPQTTDALSLALHGGEDFELLFTVRPRRAARLPDELDGVRLTEIGEVTNDAARRVMLLREGRAPEVLRPAGFAHFKRSARK
jgi:thiamine-monophosphate kinase